MDCTNKQANPPSTAPWLCQQVQEQSSQCDVTIKHGSWETRFHWRVLVASPFFEAIHRNNFLEKRTGIIELNKWPASLLEASLLFLYGRKPDVDFSNIDILLEIAEFLLIPGLKATCIEFLTRTEVTIYNCMHMLELSCDYGFELKTCQRFIFGRLPDVLEEEEMLNATTETVKKLLGDPTLAYVHVHDWFIFLIRWVNADEERQCMFVELFHMLDLSECDSFFINNVVAKEPLVMKNKELENTLPAGLDHHYDTVLLFTNFSQHTMACLNWRTKLWNIYDISTYRNNDDTYKFYDKPICGVKNSFSSCIYQILKMTSYQYFYILSHDLSNADWYKFKVVNCDAGDRVRCDQLDPFSLANDTLVGVFNENRRRVHRRRRKIKNRTSRTIKFSTLYFGNMIGPNTEMHAVLTIKNHRIARICRGDDGIIAMLSCDSDSLFMFNGPAAELECIQLKTSYGIDINCDCVRIKSFRDGFVLNDDSDVVCISRLSGASLQIKYHVKHLTWRKFNISRDIQVYVFDGERWFRLWYNAVDANESEASTERLWYNAVDASYSEASIRYITHDELLTIADTSLLPWKPLPLPPEQEPHFFDCNDVHAISLPTWVKMCHRKCPHCQLIMNKFDDSDDDADDDDDADAAADAAADDDKDDDSGGSRDTYEEFFGYDHDEYEYYDYERPHNY